MLIINGHKLYTELARREMSVSDLAAASGISRNSINAIAKGGQCKPQTVGKLARALGVDVTAIMADEPELPFQS